VDPARRVYLRKARDLVAGKPDKTAHDWELEARLAIGLGDLNAATTAYQRALSLAPRQTPGELPSPCATCSSSNRRAARVYNTEKPDLAA